MVLPSHNAWKDIESCRSFKNLMFPYGMQKAMETLRPGEKTPESGVYRVTHDSHRPEHLVTMLKGESLPVCSQCGDGVRFELVRAAGTVHEDEDFKVAPLE